ncbi:MAG: ribonuclease P protein component [Prolixibacteraceae bacterium]
MTDQVSQTFRKEEKLCSQKIMGELFLSGNSFLCYPVKIVWKNQDQLPSPFSAQVGFSAPKRLFKHAVDRNRLKRLLRESYRHQKSFLYEALIKANTRIALMVIYIAKEELPFNKIEPAISKAIHKISEQLSTDNGQL